MSNNKKRPNYDDSGSGGGGNGDDTSNPTQDAASKRFHRPGSASSESEPPPSGEGPRLSCRKAFHSHIDTPNLPPKIKLLCEITANTHSNRVEMVLEETGLKVSQQDVEEVLKLSYGSPAAAVKFFRWAGYQLGNAHSPYAWNLVIDLLGKNAMFEAMWNAVKSMKLAGLLSLATFASVFSSYAAADRDQEAIMAFEVMDQYGCARDIVALNSLLSAICREGKTGKAAEFLRVAKDKIRPDGDTYAILLEGWENEGNVVSAGQSFREMVTVLGWDPRNVPGYDSYLCTLLKGPNGVLEAMKTLCLMRDRKCLPGMRFFKAALEEFVRLGDTRGAGYLWESMVGKNGCVPYVEMYNSMIALHCYRNKADVAKRLLDEMVYNGAFPGSKTYNILLEFLIRDRNSREASVIFTEMIKNECIPSHANCCEAVKLYTNRGESDMALRFWKCMVENYESGLEETGNLLVVGLRDNNRLPESLKYAEDMIDRRVKLNSATLTKLKQSLARVGKTFMYEELLRKWKAHSEG